MSKKRKTQLKLKFNSFFFSNTNLCSLIGNTQCDFSAPQILREINFGHFEAPKNVILTIWAASNFEFFCEVLSFSSVEFLEKIKIQCFQNCFKKQYLLFWNQQKLFSRKIREPGKLLISTQWSIYSQSQLDCPGLYTNRFVTKVWIFETDCLDLGQCVQSWNFWWNQIKLCKL